jgi:uncharacterized membrane protein
MSHPNDPLVGEYLDAVTRATADLPADRRADLLADLREHIAAARAELVPETEAGVRTILDRLGDPAGIAAEARLGEPAPAAPAAPGPVRNTHGMRNAVLVIVAAVVLMCAVGAGLLLATHRGVPTKVTPVPAASTG